MWQPTRARCEFTHLVKVFFCTASRSSEGQALMSPRLLQELPLPASPQPSTAQPNRAQAQLPATIRSLGRRLLLPGTPSPSGPPCPPGDRFSVLYKVFLRCHFHRKAALFLTIVSAVHSFRKYLSTHYVPHTVLGSEYEAELSLVGTHNTLGSHRGLRRKKDRMRVGSQASVGRVDQRGQE